MYSLFVDSTEWVECQLHLEGAIATQNIADNLKMWEDTNKSIERTTCLKKKKGLMPLSRVSSEKFKMQMLKLLT